MLNLFRPVLIILCFSFSARISLVKGKRTRLKQHPRQNKQWEMRERDSLADSLVVGFIQRCQLVVDVDDLSSQFLLSARQTKESGYAAGCFVLFFLDMAIGPAERANI